MTSTQPLQIGTDRVLAHTGRFAIRETPDGVVFVEVIGKAEGSADLDAFFESFQPVLESHAPARVLVDLSQVEDLSMRMSRRSARAPIAGRGLMTPVVNARNAAGISLPFGFAAADRFVGWCAASYEAAC